MASSPFVFTNQMVNVSNKLWAITSAVGAGLCFLVLLVIAIVHIHPVSRHHLDRVSFRILTYSMISNTIFGFANAVGGSITGPTWACGFSIFILQFTLELSSFLLFCIALNLQLVVVHRINGQQMEKYYIFASLVMSLCLTVPPYVAKQYGWDPLSQDCWYANGNQKERLAWQIGTQLFWTTLIVIGEVCASLTALIYVYKHQIRRKRAIDSCLTSKNQQVIHATQYKSVLIRIGLYPLASCIINLTSIACVIDTTATDGIKNITDYHVILLSDFVYGGRAIVYALLAATDPALLSALKALIWHNRDKKIMSSDKGASSSSWQMTSRPATQQRTRTRYPVAVHIELETVRRGDGGAVLHMSKDAQAKEATSKDCSDSDTSAEADALPGPTLELEKHAELEEGVSFAPEPSGDGHGEIPLNLVMIRHDSEGRRREALEMKLGRDAFRRQI